MANLLIEKRLEYILETLEKTRRTVENVQSNQELDRKDFSEFSVRLGNLEIIVKELKEQVFKMPRKTSDQVEEALQPMLDETQDLKETIEDKKTLSFKQPKPKPWWKIF